MASESAKIKDKIEKYLEGEVIEIGCGDEPVKEGVFGVDGRDFPCVTYRTSDLYNLPSQIPDKLEKFDCCFSSHVLEHLPDSFRCILEWSQFVKKDGYFILYLPEGSAYDNFSNPEHFHDTRYEQFLFWFKRTFCGEALNFTGQPYFHPLFEIVESGLDLGENKYSFYLVAKKIM